MARKPIWYAGRWWRDERGTRAWRKLRDQVVSEEPACWLRLPGCTGLSTTADHVLTVKDRPDLQLVRGNLHGACGPCNLRRNDRAIGDVAPAESAEALGFFD